jgi:CARDB protein
VPGDTDVLKADLFPGSIDTPFRVRIDAVLQMRVGVRNDGNCSAGPGWVVRVLASGDPQIDASDRQIDQVVTTRELPPGGQDRYLRNKKLSGLKPGDYYVGSIVDVTQVVPELTETNNTLASPARITLLPIDVSP